MATLTEEQKLFIVTRLAMYDTPTMVSVALKEEFGVDVPRNQINGYDPEKTPQRVSKKLRVVFEAARKNFIDDVASIPIAQRSYRLRRLNQIHERMMEKKNFVAAAAALEQAAKEAGDVFTNLMKVKGNLDHKHEHEHSFSEDEKRATLADLIEQAMTATAPASPSTH